MVELYHFWSSVCSVRCRMALEEKGVEWTSRYIDLFNFDQMTPDYLAINPAGVVPTLVHDGEPITESTIINEYIDDAFDGPALTPENPLQAARMREFIRFCEDNFDGIVKLTAVKYLMPKLRNRWSDEELAKQAKRRPMAFYKDIHGRALRGEIGADELAEAQGKIIAILDRLETMVSKNDWIAGDALSLADITVAPYLFRLNAIGAGLFWSDKIRPNIHAYYGRLSNKPSFQKAVSWPDETGGGYEEVGLGEKQAK